MPDRLRARARAKQDGRLWPPRGLASPTTTTTHAHARARTHAASLTPRAPAPQLKSPSKAQVIKAEKRRLRELAKMRKVHMEKMLAEQNAAVAAQSSGKQKLQFLLKQTDVFATLMNSSRADALDARKKKGKGKKLTEEEEDADFAKEDTGPMRETRLTVQPTCIKGEMRDYQLAGLNWLIRCYDHGINGILADEMGLGKTLQSISLLGYLHEYRGITGPHMVLAPKSTLGNWIREFQRFCPSLRVFKFLGNQEERNALKEKHLQPGEFDVVVTSYEMVIREKSAFRKFNWRYIVIDEAHRIKNENSVLSKTIRTFHSNFRLLITGTPLQNNLHELWALLNFLLPDVFRHADDFDELFNVEDGDQAGVVKQLHKVLRPFLLRRLKSEVRAGVPPKKETILKVGLSEMQKQYYKSLLQKDVSLIKGGGERSRLLNIIMQLRKCTNHPYLFQGAEPGPPYITGEHLIENAGKMVLLDRLLKRLKENGSRVLIFSQMTRLLDILEDYCMYRGHQYCRIDGNTSGDDRDEYIDSFNKEGSEKFIFLLSTRAGGLGINLASADIVILFDSDWNPQMDLQAMDRAHRIGQKKEVHVYRFCTDGTVEEKIIEKAYKKLALDALVIQQGRLADSRAQVSKDELLGMVRYGAEKIFQGSGATITDDDIDAIIRKGESDQDELTKKMKEFSAAAQGFSMDGGDLNDFANEDAAKNVEEFDGEVIKTMVAANWVDPPKRERKKNYSEAQMFGAMRATQPKGPKELRLPRMQQYSDYQFFNTTRLKELYDKEGAYLLYRHQKRQKEAAARAARELEAVPTTEVPADEDDPNAPQPLSEEEEGEKAELLQSGFSEWSRREYQAFVRACEKHGRHDHDNIAAELSLIETQHPKSVEDVKKYAGVFWERLHELSDHERVIKTIERGEQKIQRKLEIQASIGRKLAEYKNPWRDLKLQYGQNKGKSYTEDEDRFILCMTHQLGYGAFDELKLEVRKSWMYRFDWFVKSRTSQELQRRVDTLVRIIEKEFEDADGKKRKGGGGQAGGSAKKVKA